MAHLSIPETNSRLRKAVADAVLKVFPITDGKTEIRAKNVTADTPFDPAALKEHQHARLHGGSRQIPILADLELVRDGKVVQTRTQAKIGDLPLLSGFGGAVVGGNDYIPYFAQLRLKPGVYTRVAPDDSVESVIHVAGARVTIWMEPARGILKLGIGTTNVNFLPVALALGATREQLIDAIGADLYDRNMPKRGDGDADITKLYETAAKLKVKRDLLAAGIVERDEAKVNVSREEKVAFLKSWLEGKALDPYVTRKTLGTPFTQAGIPVMLAAAKKLIKVYRKEVPGDDRDAPEFKSAHDIADLMAERITQLSRMWAYEVKTKMKNKPEATLSQLVGRDFINDGTVGYFLGSPGKPPGLANTAELPNPLAILSNRDKLTVTGPGGIGDAHAVTNEARLFRPGAAGFVDPVQTPEGSSVGVTTHAALYTKVKDKTLVAPMYPVVNGKMQKESVEVSVEEANDAVISLPESWDMKTGEPTGAKVRVVKDHQIYEDTPDRVKYVVPSGVAMFSAVSNAASFLAHTHPNRGMMVGKHLTQTVPLKYRELPLAKTKMSDGKDYNARLGRSFAIQAEEAGTVTAVGDGVIKVGDKSYEYFDHYPMQAAVSLHHEPRVKVGDTVKAGDILADINYTKDGDYAPGVNLRSAYTPWRNAANFEDAIVVSESAAQKLTAEKTYTLNLWPITEDTVIGAKEYLAQFPTKLDNKKMAKLDANGLIKEGQTVEMGDVVIAAMRKADVDAQDRRAENYGSIHKKLLRPWRDVAVTWKYPVSGKVVRVVRTPKQINVYVRADVPLQVGDKLSNGAAAKGTISEIIPDDKMPHDEKGRPIEIILNPHGVAGRINPSQTIEQAVGKYIRDGGGSYEYSHFDGKDHATAIHDALKSKGMTHEEHLFDPITGRKTELPVATGYNYMVRLDHDSFKKLSARSRANYTDDERPGKGKGQSAQSFDGLTTAALLGHNAHAILGESFGIRGTKNDEFWAAFQAGEQPPPPKVPYAWHKFEAMLHAAGINTERNGKWLHFFPMTEGEIKKRSHGEITDGRMLRSKDLAEHKDGLFDPDKTGGVFGDKWAHIQLPERMPHPLYEKVIRDVAGMKGADYLGLIAGTRHYDPKSKKFLEEPTAGTVTGAAAFEKVLDFDVDARLKEVKEKAKTAVGSDKNKLARAARYLEGLKESGMKPNEAYLTSVLPVIPPKYRPIVEQANGGLRVADSNLLYRDVLLTSRGLEEAEKAGMPAQELGKARIAVYDAIAGVVGVGAPLTKRRDQAELQGVVQLIKGKSAKEGLFQQTLARRRNDYSARAVIETGGDLGPDEVALPEDMAWEIYKAVGIRRLSQLGNTPADAMKSWEDRTQAAREVLAAEMRERPVLYNRAPSLHKLSIMAAWPRLTSGSALRISPTAMGPFGADFDGDTMSVFTPITDAAKQEAIKMLPSKNLFYDRDRSIAYGLEKDIITGLFMLTRQGQPTDKKYESAADAIRAYEANRDNLRMNSLVDVPGYKTKPTVGQLIFEDMVPARYRGGITYPLDGKKLETILRNVAEQNPSEYNRIIRAMSIAGFEYSARSGGITGTVAELTVDRSKVTRLLDQLEGKIRGAGSPEEAKRVAKSTFLNETKKDMEVVVGDHLAKVGLGGSIFFQAKPSSKLGFDSFMQMMASPTLVTDVKGEVIPSVIRSSYGSGMRPGDYLLTTPGARSGMVAKSLSTALPGALAKEINANMTQVRISVQDCGTSNGIEFSLTPDATIKGYDADLLDRHLAEPAGPYPKNAVVTPRVLEDLRQRKLGHIKVRSPMTCTAAKPPCSMCAPVHPDGRPFAVGDNIGYDFGQSVGERSTQQILRCVRGNIRTNTETIPLAKFWATVAAKFPVLTEDGVDTVKPVGLTVPGRGGPTEVWQVERHRPMAPMLLFTLASGTTHECQEDHPVWTMADAAIVEAPAHTCGVGDYLYRVSATGYLVSDQIVSVSEANDRDYVYDLKTDSKSYIVNDVLTHNSFHSGGTVGSGEGLNRGFARLSELLHAPETVKDQGTLAEVAGTVENITLAPQGGEIVTIAGQEHYIRPGRARKVKPGEHVTKGQALSDGNFLPQDIARLRGTLPLQHYLVDEMRAAFQSTGAVMRKPVLEVVAASIGRYVEITDDGGAPGVVAGDVLHENEATELKKSHPKLSWVPTMPGVMQLPLKRSKDPLERLNFQRLEDTLRQGPAAGGKSDLSGSESPVAGLAYGAMFRSDSAFTRNPAGSHP